jgi:hypothetical protein
MRRESSKNAGDGCSANATKGVRINALIGSALGTTGLLIDATPLKSTTGA